jgi:hypothetical protein
MLESFVYTQDKLREASQGGVGILIPLPEILRRPSICEGLLQNDISYSLLFSRQNTSAYCAIRPGTV